jgi:hypothetical protein
MPAVNRYYSSVAIDTTLSSSITSTATSLVVGSTSGFPTSYPYTLAIGYDLSNEELVTIIGASGTTLTVGTTVAGGANVSGRGVDGTSDQAHTAGEPVKHVISARDMTEAQAHIAAESGAHGITGSFVGTTDTQTLTNKTITGGTVNATTLQQGGVPAVTTTGTQTLTNKTLTSPTINSATLTGTLTNTSTLSGGTLSGVSLSGTTNAGSGTMAFGTNASAITANGNTISAAEVGYLDGVTSAIQTQINTKAPTANPTFTGTVTLPTGTVTSGMILDGAIVDADINASAAIDWNKLAVSSTVSATEIGYVDGVTSAIQTQLDSKAVQGSGGLPYRMSSGIASTTFVASATSGVTTVNFPTSRFTEAPVVVAQVTGFAGSLAGATIRLANVTDTSFQMTMTLNASTTTTANFHWTAVQMTTTPYTVGTAQ